MGRDGERNVKIQFDESRKKINVYERIGKPLRMIDLRGRENRQIDKLHIWISEDTGMFVSVRTEGEIDLVSFTYQFLLLNLFISPDLKYHVSYCHHIVVICMCPVLYINFYSETSWSNGNKLSRI